jgi:hypothetical protein
MQEAPELAALRHIPWQKVFLFSVATLTSTIVLKFGAIQYLELVYFALIFVLLLLFVENGYHSVWFRLIFWLAMGYALFCLVALLLGIASLRFVFYLPLWLPPLKGPLWITVARILELVASVAGMLYMGQIFGDDASKLKFTMKVYFWTGVASGVFGLISLPMAKLGHNPGGFYDNRLRGFYNEGGPYGLYVVSVLIVGWALDRFGWMPRKLVRWLLALMCVVFILTFSKAGMTAIVTMFALNALLARNLTTRLTTIGIGLAVFVGITQIIDLPAVFRIYRQTAAQYEQLSQYHPEDFNFVYGRVAGAFIVPRMIEAHPLTGVGWGNYGLLRNAPEYRGAAYFTEYADDPALGLLGVAAELGLPLTGFLLLLMLTPFFYLRRLRLPNWAANLALLQFAAHLYGAQLNVTYPWVVSAFALGVGISTSRTGHLPGQQPEIAVS